MWQVYNDKDLLPAAGGWLDQPLSVLIGIKAIDLVYHTFKYKNSKDANWGKMSVTQRELIKWLENNTA